MAEKNEITTQEAIDILKRHKDFSRLTEKGKAAYDKAIEALKEQEKYSWIFNYSDTLEKHDWNAIEKALGYKLFVWQKLWIDDVCEVYGQRRTGKTVAEALKLLLTGVEKKPMDFSIMTSNPQNRIFKDTVFDMRQRLDEAGIKTRPVFFSVAEKREYYQKQEEKRMAFLNTVNSCIYEMIDKLIKEEDELLYRCLYSYGITKENLLNNIDRIECREANDGGTGSVKRFYIDGKYAFTIRRVSTMFTYEPTSGYTKGFLCYKVEQTIEDLEEE